LKTKNLLVALMLVVALTGCEDLQNLFNPVDEGGSIGSYGTEYGTTASSFHTAGFQAMDTNSALEMDFYDVCVTQDGDTWDTLMDAETVASTTRVACLTTPKRVKFYGNKYYKMHEKKKKNKGWYHGIKIKTGVMNYVNTASSETYWNDYPVKYFTYTQIGQTEIFPDDEGYLSFTTANGGLWSAFELTSDQEISIVMEARPRVIDFYPDNMTWAIVIAVRTTGIVSGEVIED